MTTLPEYIMKDVIASVAGKEEDFIVHSKKTSPHTEVMERNNMHTYTVVFTGDKRTEHPYFKRAIQTILKDPVSKCTILVDLIQKKIILLHLQLFRNPNQEYVTVYIMDRHLNVLQTYEHQEVMSLSFASSTIQAFVKDVFLQHPADGSVMESDCPLVQYTSFVKVLREESNRLKNSQ
jgi:hypothetical protein